MRDASTRSGLRARVAAFVLFALAFTFACVAASPTSAYAYDQDASDAVAKVTGNDHDGHWYYAHSVKDAMDCISDMASTREDSLHESNITIDLMTDWNTKDYGRLKFQKSGVTYNINLHGHMINRDEAEANGKWSGKSYGEVIMVYRGATVNIDGGSGIDEASREHPGYFYDNEHFWKASVDRGDNPIDGGLITGGATHDKDGAGGITVMAGATLNLSNVTVAGNIADTYSGWWGYGGGISLLGDKAKLTMNNAKVMYNHAMSCGGGVFVKEQANGCEIKLSNNSNISNNSSRVTGGGICDKGYNTAIDINDSSLLNNCTGLDGAAIALRQAETEGAYLSDKGPTVNVCNSVISGNQAGGSGGGIASFKMGSQITLRDTLIDNNTVSGSGGGVYLVSLDKLTTYGSTGITNNSASVNGGGIACAHPINYGGYTDPVTVSLGDATVVSGNTATNGGGIHYYLSLIHI